MTKKIQISKLKIIHIHFSLINAGSENMMVDLINHQLSYVSEISMIIINDTIDQSLLNRVDKRIRLNFINRPAKSKNPIYLIKLFFLLVKHYNYHIIHTHSLQLGIFLMPFIYLKKVVRLHDSQINQVHLKYFRKIIVASRFMKEQLNKYYKEKTIVIYNGINHPLIKMKRHFYGDMIRLVQISRLEHQVKGQDILLKALALIRLNQKISTPFTLDIIGGGSSDNFLKELSEELGLSKIVNFIGEKSREYIYEHLSDYDILIQPSRTESFGLTIIEAGFAKVGIIASNIEGPAEILEINKRSCLFESENIEELSEQILKMIRLIQDNEIVSLVNQIYDRFKVKYSIEETTKRYLEEYNL